MQYEDLMRPDEDWVGSTDELVRPWMSLTPHERELGDPSERRKIQNRIAQRAYRRNMRERAEKIDSLSKQLQEYQELYLDTEQPKNGVGQQSSSPSMLAPEKLSTQQQAMPPAVPSEEPYHLSLTDDCQLACIQEQLSPGLVDRQPSSVHSPRNNTRRRMKASARSNSSTAFREPTTTALGVARPQCESKDDGMRPPSPTHLPGILYDGYALDTADLGDRSQPSTSLLHLAVAGNHIDTVAVLLHDERVGIDDEDAEGFTALQRAVMQGKSDIVKLLLEHGANIGQASGCYPPPVDGFGLTFLEP